MEQTTKLFNVEDDDLEDILEYIVIKVNPYCYSYLDDNGKLWYLVSLSQLDEEDLDFMFESKIASYDNSPVGMDLEEEYGEDYEL